MLNNRNRNFIEIKDKENNHDNKYSMVAGPVADDALAVLFRTLSNGLIDMYTLVKEMKFKRFTNLYSLQTERAINYLKVRRQNN